VQGIWNLDYLETANYLFFTLLRGQSSGSLSAYRQLSVLRPWRSVLKSVSVSWLVKLHTYWCSVVFMASLRDRGMVILVNKMAGAVHEFHLVNKLYS